MPGAVRHNIIVQAFKIRPIDGADATGGRPPACEQIHLRGRGHWYDHFLPYREIRRGDIMFSSSVPRPPRITSSA